MICMIPNVNLRDGELGFMFCDLHLSQNNPWWWGGGGAINLTDLPCLT